uniref:Ribonuclease P RNA n=1 Tax=Gayliella sp. TaxID=2575623 RepID=A0A4D6WTL5_9FLOR|nr:ribonuclease P RNA [Gayliella sp.]
MEESPGSSREYCCRKNSIGNYEESATEINLLIILSKGARYGKSIPEIYLLYLLGKPHNRAKQSVNVNCFSIVNLYLTDLLKLHNRCYCIDDNYPFYIIYKLEQNPA